MKKIFNWKLVVAILIAVVLELTVLQFGFWSMRISNVETNLVYTIDDFETEGWKEQGDKLVSEGGQHLVLRNLSTQVQTVYLDFEISPAPDYTLLFYNTEKETPFSDATSLLYSTKELQPKVYMNDLRIDFSNQPGLTLSGLTVTINRAIYEFSFARVIAIILIYLFGKLLFYIQTPIDYLLEEHKP